MSEEDSLVCHCEPRTGEAIPYEKVRLPRFARNGGLPRRYAPSNDIVKIYIAFTLDFVQRDLLY